MGVKIKNIIVLAIVFTSISLLALWSLKKEKIVEDASQVSNREPEGAIAEPEVVIDTSAGKDISPAEDYHSSIPGNPKIVANHEYNIMHNDASTYLSLGMKYYEKEDLGNALSYFKEALRLSPADENIKRLVAKVSREAKVEGDFVNKEGSHFTVRYEGGENDVAGHVVAIILEEAYLKVGSDLGFYPEESVTAILYTSQQFTDVTRAPSWSGAIYDGKIRLPVGGVRERTDVLERVLFHEYTHALIYRLGGARVPVWLNEGIAQYEEGGLSDKEEMLRYLASSGNIIPLDYLEGSFMGMNQEQAAKAYAESFSAVKYIIDEYGFGMLKRLIISYNENSGSDVAIKDTFHMNYKEFQESWLRNLTRRYGSGEER